MSLGKEVWFCNSSDWVMFGTWEQRNTDKWLLTNVWNRNDELLLQSLAPKSKRRNARVFSWVKWRRKLIESSVEVFETTLNIFNFSSKIYCLKFHVFWFLFPNNFLYNTYAFILILLAVENKWMHNIWKI